MCVIHVTGWPQPDRLLEEPVEASGDARLALWRSDPGDRRHLPPPGQEGVLFATSSFSLMNGGNRAFRAPKRSWKLDLQAEGGDARSVGTSRLNLKAMFNDPAQMREVLAWKLFGKVGVPSSRHTYAKFGINERYMGLFSVVEQVDRRFLEAHFGENDEGNLFKACCGDLGCATLERRVGANGDDSGRQYRPAEGSTDRPIASRGTRTTGRPIPTTTSQASSGPSTGSGRPAATADSTPTRSGSPWRAS
jgi:hypothetical protein